VQSASRRVLSRHLDFSGRIAIAMLLSLWTARNPHQIR